MEKGMIYQEMDRSGRNLYPHTVTTAVFDPETGRNIKDILEGIEAGEIPSATDNMIYSLFGVTKEDYYDGWVNTATQEQIKQLFK